MPDTARQKAKTETIDLAAFIADLRDFNKEAARVIHADFVAGETVDDELLKTVDEAWDELEMSVKVLRLRLAP